MKRTVYVTRRSTFSASHRLYNPALSEAENNALFDKCANPHGHGHNYVLEVTVAGTPGENSGYVIDLKKLKHIIQEEVLSRLDHKHLNHDVEFFQGLVPTAENIAVVIWDILAPRVKDGRLFSIRLHETENNVVEYRGE
ncbi:MAG TPA: 6-carboxytetrahydropterin synthase [Bacteroidota bacterium]|nr:6-carboxytetrahydropterin synthase [Bacteroidota bacterium]